MVAKGMRTAARSETGEEARRRLLSGVPVTERHVESEGLSTAVLAGGNGPPLVLLHGPGESAINWRWTIPRMIADHHVIAPDLPAHGNTGVPSGEMDAEFVIPWLRRLIEQTCPSPPVVVGHVLGGAIAARFAVEHSERIRRLVLVDTLGLARFRPSLGFALTMFAFLSRPTDRSYERFMGQCAYDLDALRGRMGSDWNPFVTYNVSRARSPNARAAGELMRRVGLPRIPPEDLGRITVPTTLIWGRGDRANRLRVAEAASARYGWELHVVERAADDPARDQPDAFVKALRRTVDTEEVMP